mgnify:CR=1 FL=1|jgi:transcriptional regulator with XRE-family HTH domain|tara:strand:+ start:1123 stop:1494 length:372 start_codon:yes stop_codon:yes gene_type:complete
MTTTRKIDGTAESRSNRLLGQRIALYRAAGGLTLTDLGLAIGISHQIIQRYETGEMPVPFGRLVQLARSLNVPVRTLIGDVFDTDPGAEPAAPIVLQIAGIAGRLPPAKRAALAALARELGRP